MSETMEPVGERAVQCSDMEPRAVDKRPGTVDKRPGTVDKRPGTRTFWDSYIMELGTVDMKLGTMVTVEHSPF